MYFILIFFLNLIKCHRKTCVLNAFEEKLMNWRQRDRVFIWIWARNKFFRYLLFHTSHHIQQLPLPAYTISFFLLLFLRFRFFGFRFHKKAYAAVMWRKKIDDKFKCVYHQPLLCVGISFYFVRFIDNYNRTCSLNNLSRGRHILQLNLFLSSLIHLYIYCIILLALKNNEEFNFNAKSI